MPSSPHALEHASAKRGTHRVANEAQCQDRNSEPGKGRLEWDSAAEPSEGVTAAPHLPEDLEGQMTGAGGRCDARHAHLLQPLGHPAPLSLGEGEEVKTADD